VLHETSAPLSTSTKAEKVSVTVGLQQLHRRRVSSGLDVRRPGFPSDRGRWGEERREEEGEEREATFQCKTSPMPGGIRASSPTTDSSNQETSSQNTRQSKEQIRTSVTSELRPPASAWTASRGRASETQPAHLLVLVLLQVARGHQALRVDVGGDGLNELRVGVHVLHLEEGQNVLDLQVVGAVGHGLPFGGQATRGHPVGVLFLLGRKVKRR